jgi:perosamine synthetase
MFDSEIKFIKEIYFDNEIIPLHEPKFFGNEKKYLDECIDSTYVSSVGKFVDHFELKIAEYTGSKYAIATSNGTSALHIALLLSNVRMGDEVITQPLTFVATCNAITYCGAEPIFIDVDRETMGLCPNSLNHFLENFSIIINNECINKNTGKKIKACIPMHTFGNPCRIDEIQSICEKYHIKLIEDAAESLGSFFQGQHTGTFGLMGTFSFNGNKIITSGGGGCIVTDDKELAKKAKHLTTTAKISHKWEFMHDMTGYNYRMPNLNAALLVAQFENLEFILKKKRELAIKYSNVFNNNLYTFVRESKDSSSNHWLNSIIFKQRKHRDLFLEKTNSQGIMTRPIWSAMNNLPMFKNSFCASLENSIWLEQRVVNIPSSITT